MNENQTYKTYYLSPVGWLQISGSERYIISVLYVIEENEGSEYLPDIIIECVKQLDEYFKKERETFDLPLQQAGTLFQKKVWNELLNIPYGETISYQELAERIGNIRKAQAVGSANGKNKINIIVPCHRVIGKDGNLKGYSGGCTNKDWLLKHESKLITSQQKLF